MFVNQDFTLLILNVLKELLVDQMLKLLLMDHANVKLVSQTMMVFVLNVPLEHSGAPPPINVSMSVAKTLLLIKLPNHANALLDSD